MDVPKVDILFILGNGAHAVRTAEFKELYLAVNVDALAAAFEHSTPFSSLTLIVEMKPIRRGFQAAAFPPP